MYKARINFTTRWILLNNHLIYILRHTGWQIALISFVTFLHQERKVRAEKPCKVYEDLNGCNGLSEVI